MATAKIEKARVKEILAKLDELGGKAFAEEDIVYEGNKLVVPVGMNLRDVIVFADRKIKEDEENAAFSRTFKYRPWDGAYCAYRVLKNTFGSVSHQGSMGFFGRTPPQLITIDVNIGETEQIPWGEFGIPVLPDVDFSFGATHDEEYGLVFQVYANGPKVHRFRINAIFDLIERELAEHSIYRGKAIDGKEQPSFIDLRDFDPEQIVYSGDVKRLLTSNVLSLLRHTEKMRKNGMPLKRAVLMYGPYGTGKSEFGRITAAEAVANGWTFILARTGRDDLNQVMQTARLYGPAVVMFEDIDVIADPDSRDRDGISQLLDTFDGITAKGTDLVMILTTNHPDRIHKGILRPGRLDAAIKIGHLDREGVAQLVRNRIKGTSSQLETAPNGEEMIDWDAVFAAMQGFTPAFVKEAADRAFRDALTDNGGEPARVLDTEHLVVAGNGLRSQLELMEGAKEHPAADPLRDMHEKVVRDTVIEVLAENLDARIVRDGGTVAEKQNA